MSKGHIRELSPGRWQLMYDVEADPITGRRRQRSKVVRGARDAAELELARILSERNEGLPQEDRSLTVARLTELWLMARRTQLRSTTLVGYRQKLGYVTRMIGHRRVAGLTGGVITAMYGRLLEQGLSPRSVMHVHRVLRRMLADAVRWGYIRSNPTDAADAPHPDRVEMGTWTATQLRTFLDRWATDRWYPAWHLVATTGIRRGELSGLRWDDLVDDVLEVQRSVSRRDGVLEAGPPKTSAGRRSIALDAGTVQVLARWRQRQLEERMVMGGEWRGEGWMFAMEDGRLVDPDLFTHRWQKAVRRTPELPAIRLHDLRHTWATLAIKAGVPAKVVAERLGHSSVTVTLDVYTHRVDELHREAAEKVSLLIGGLTR